MFILELFSYTMIREPGNAIGVKVGGSWDGIVGQVARHVTCIHNLQLF